MVENIYENIQIVSWQEARDDIIKVNPPLVKIIDDISPSKKYKLIKAKYCYGDLIVNHGQLQLPIAKEHTSTVSSLSSHGVDSSLTSLLNYSSIPLTILLNKMSDIFAIDDDCVVPLKVFNPGDIFGTFEVLNYLISRTSISPWCVSAGSRLIFTLPKISEANSFKKLRFYYDLKSDPPRTLSEHWDLFKQIANHTNFEENWSSDVILFTKDWFFPATSRDKNWQEFQLFLFKQGWVQGKNILEKEKLNFFWRIFTKAISQRRLNSPHYLMDTLKHLLLICIGEAPAFQPLVTDLAAPCRGLQNVLLTIYELKNYIPTLMHLALSNQELPLYYSLAFPTILEGSSDKKYRPSTLMADLKDLKLMLDTILKNSGAVKNSFLEYKKFDFFHIQEEQEAEIKPSHLLLKEDDRFADSKFPALNFCSTSPFWRGCIKIGNLASS